MKKNTFLISLLLSTLFLIGQGQEAPPKVENLGLISELAYMKMTTEHLAIRVANDSLLDEPIKKQFVNEYNTAKVLMDQLLLQLISDCKSKNSLKYFKKLDKLLRDKKIANINSEDKNNKKVKKYIANLVIVSQYFQELNSFYSRVDIDPDAISLEGLFPAVASVEEITGVLSFITSKINAAKESRMKKVEKITQILNELRLSPIQDLLKKKDDK